MQWRNPKTKILMMSRYDHFIRMPFESIKLNVYKKMYERYIDSLEAMEQLKEQFEKNDPKKFDEILKQHKEDGQGLFDKDDPLDLEK